MTENRPGDPEIRVFLLDDHELVRIGVRDLLEAQPDIQVIGEAGTAAVGPGPDPGPAAERGDPGRAAAGRGRDQRLPRNPVPDAGGRLPDADLLQDDQALFDAVMAGAGWYVLKQIHRTDLGRGGTDGGLRPVHARSPRGQQADGPATGCLAEARPAGRLTGQERRILELIGEGLTNRQIGERMFLAEKTVKNYVSALFQKLGMERRTQAAAYAAHVFSEHGPDHSGVL